MSCYTVYVIGNARGDRYVGQTNDVAKRLQQHNDPLFRGTLHTKRRRGPWKLLYTETFVTRAEAMRRERYLKTGRGREWLRAQPWFVGEGVQSTESANLPASCNSHETSQGM